MKKYKIFISSVQNEFHHERQMLRNYIKGDILLSRFFDVLLFEDLSARDMRADEVYLNEVKQCDIYLGLFGTQYGVEDKAGFSPTHKEFNLATKLDKSRLIFIKGSKDVKRHSKMKKLIHYAENQLVRSRFNTDHELTSAIYASLIQFLHNDGRFRIEPFDVSICHSATIDDISYEKIRWFLRRAHNIRDYALDEDTPIKDVLTHLNLLNKEKLTHAGILLFGIKPQRFLTTSEVKCMHFYGTKKIKPIPSYQIYKGTVFDLVDQSIDFVMSKLNRFVGTRENGPEAPVIYEIPQEVVAEGIVNAIAHRDYISNASVEIILFSDRLEIWNPGTLPPSLTIESLSLPHASQPANPLIAEPFFLTKYIEKAGTGTVEIYNNCKKAGLKPPIFKLQNGFFILTIWRKISGLPITTQSATQFSDPVLKILLILQTGEYSSSQLRAKLNLKHRPTFRKNYLHPALEKDLIEYTIPNSPNSSLQKYRITQKGSDYLNKHKGTNL